MQHNSIMGTPSSDTSSGLLSPVHPLDGNDDSPYSIGQCLFLKRHNPPAPFGRKYRDSGASEFLVPGEVTQLEWCLKHPPKPGSTDVSETRNIVFKASIRTGDQRGAQVLLTENGLVAKIYDPLYYSFIDKEWSDEKLDVATEADQDYTIEAAAYSALQGSNLQGNIMPTYHGSWTTEIRTIIDGQQHLRDVRIILLEHVDGTVMMDIDPDSLTQGERENVMCKVIEARTDLKLADLQHNDFEPRNIVLSPRSSRAQSAPGLETTTLDCPDLRVCIIDYGRSYVAKTTTVKDVYRNPLFDWAGGDIYCQYGWLPPREEATDWMWEMWGNGGRDGKYVKVERDLDDILGQPVYPEE